MRTYKVLPFDTKKYHVPGHEIGTHKPEFMKGQIDKVVFSVWDDEAKMKVEIHVAWQNFTEYTKKKWPSGHSVVAVLTDQGQRISAKSWSVAHQDGEAYLKAPILCRDAFLVTTLSGDHLLEVVGVSEWSRSARDEAATAKHLACPWERDNRVFEERMNRKGMD